MPDPSPSEPLAPDMEFGEWFYQQIDEAFLVKRSEWADGITARLQSGRPQGERREVIVIWLSAMTAFTAPGRYIYVTGRLMEYCHSEGALAFTIGHELAHHDLGHLRRFPRWFHGVAMNWIKELIFLVVHSVQHFLYSPERESAADRHALDLCIKAGYNPDECLQPVVFVTAYDESAIQAFDVHALDYILKPIEPARFKKALARAMKRGPLDRLVVRSKGKFTFVKPGDIDW